MYMIKKRISKIVGRVSDEIVEKYKKLITI